MIANVLQNNLQLAVTRAVECNTGDDNRLCAVDGQLNRIGCRHNTKRMSPLSEPFAE
jgi:hypothetical protein